MRRTCSPDDEAQPPRHRLPASQPWVEHAMVDLAKDVQILQQNLCHHPAERWPGTLVLEVGEQRRTGPSPFAIANLPTYLGTWYRRDRYALPMAAGPTASGNRNCLRERGCRRCKRGRRKLQPMPKQHCSEPRRPVRRTRCHLHVYACLLLSDHDMFGRSMDVRWPRECFMQHGLHHL